MNESTQFHLNDNDGRLIRLRWRPIRQIHLLPTQKSRNTYNKINNITDDDDDNNNNNNNNSNNNNSNNNSNNNDNDLHSNEDLLKSHLKPYLKKQMNFIMLINHQYLKKEKKMIIIIIIK